MSRADVPRRFSTPVADRYAGIEWHPGTTRAPVLHADSLSWLECRLEQVDEQGLGLR